MKKKLLILLLLTIALTVIVLLYTSLKDSIKNEVHLEVTGIIEATEVNAASKISERIEWLCCREGDAVKKGDILVKLDHHEFTAKLNEARAVLQGADAVYKVSKANVENASTRVEGARAELKAAESEIERVKATFKEADDNFQRISALFKQGYASKKDHDMAKASHDTSRAQLRTAKAKKDSLKAALTTATAGLKAAEAQVESAKAAIEEAGARLKLIETQSKDTEILSPIEGMIAYKSFEAGELVPAGKTIYTLYDIKDIWARVDIDESRIGSIRLGSKAVITAESLPDKKYDSEVIEIGREAEFATQRDVTRGRQDIKTFRVKVVLKDPEGYFKPGMTVMVRFSGSSTN